jgi:hypothetical protein
MRREFLSVWQYLWTELWEPLGHHELAPEDLFVELYRILYPALAERPDPKTFAETSNNPAAAWAFFETVKAEKIRSERQFLLFLEGVGDAIDELDVPILRPVYEELVGTFVVRHHLRYRINKPFHIVPTIEGMFDSLIEQLRTLASNDAAVSRRLAEFEDAIGDLRTPRNPNKLKRCIHTGFNLIEGMGVAHPSTKSDTLGRICEEIGTWPHDKVKESVKSLCSFANDYDGIRHAGTLNNMKREIELRDAVALIVFIAGSMPYLTDRLDHERIIGGI